jgi:hypothetical protein
MLAWGCSRGGETNVSFDKQGRSISQMSAEKNRDKRMLLVRNDLFSANAQPPVLQLQMPIPAPFRA